MIKKFTSILLLFLLPLASYCAGLDADTNLLMPFDGVDASTTMPDSSLTNNKGNATVGGTVFELDTAQQKWGTASFYSDGIDTNEAGVSYADDDDWDVVASNADSWTIDAWIRPDNINKSQAIVSHGSNNPNTNEWIFRLNPDNQVLFQVNVESSTVITLQTTQTISADTWTHVALVKVADEYGIYIGGDQDAYVEDTSTGNFSATLHIGRDSIAPRFFYDGWIDELRIQESNYFNVTPQSDNSGTLTVPTGAYSEGGRRIVMIQ